MDQLYEHDTGGGFKHLVRHTQFSKNFGLLGGWLRVEFFTFTNGDPSGITRSRIQYEGVNV